MRLEEYKPLVDCSNIRAMIKKRGLKISWLAKELGQTEGSLSQITMEYKLPGSMWLAHIANCCRCPISELVEFKGITIKDGLGDKKFETKSNCKGKVSYAPLFSLLNSMKSTYPTYDDFFDNLPSNINVRDGLYFGKYSRGEKKGLAEAQRRNLLLGRNVSIKVLYEICKLLNCSIDCIVGWQ